jgi:hypothetical protein
MRGVFLLGWVLAVGVAGCATAGGTGSSPSSASDGRVFETSIGTVVAKVPMPAGWYVVTWEPTNVVLSRRAAGGVAMNPTIEIVVEAGPLPYDQPALTKRQVRRALDHLGGQVVFRDEWAPVEKKEGHGIAGTGSLRMGGKFHDVRWHFYDGESEGKHLVMASACAPRGDLGCDAEFSQMVQELEASIAR